MPTGLLTQRTRADPAPGPGRALPPTQGLQRNSRLLGSYRSHLVHGVERVQLRGHTEVHVPPQEASETCSTAHGQRPPPSCGWIGRSQAGCLSAVCRPVPAFPLLRSTRCPVQACPGYLPVSPEPGPDRPGPALQQYPKPLCFRCFPSNGRDVRQTHEVPVRSEPRTRHTWGSRRQFLPPSGLARSVQ